MSVCCLFIFIDIVLTVMRSCCFLFVHNGDELCMLFVCFYRYCTQQDPIINYCLSSHLLTILSYSAYMPLVYVL